MAESGQTDDNIMRPDGTVAPTVDRRPEWKAERARMITHIASSVMDEMSDEEMYRQIMHEKYRFEENKVEEFQVDSQEPRMSGTMLDEIRVTPNKKQIAIADVGISEEARLRKEEKRRNLY